MVTTMFFRANFLCLIFAVQKTVAALRDNSKPLEIVIATCNTDAAGPSKAQHDPLMYLGMEYLRRAYQREFNFTLIPLKPYPDEKSPLDLDDAVAFVADVYYQNRGLADGITVMTSCSADVYQQVGLVTKELDVLFTCSVGNSGTPKVFPQLITLSIYPVQTLLQSVILFLKHYNWTDIAVLIDESSIEREYLHLSILAAFDVAFRGEVKIPDFTLNSYSVFKCSAQSTLGLDGTLRKIAEISRVIFIFGSGRAARAIMRSADRLGMTSGEFVFVMSTLQTQDKRDRLWMITDKNELMNIPFQVMAHPAALLLSFVVSNAEKSVALLEKDVIKVAREHGGYVYPRDTVPIQVFSLYDAFLIYGIVMNETYYANNGSLPEGRELAHRYFNRSFTLPTGDVYVNEHGERTCDILGQLYSSASGTYQTVIRYDHVGRGLVDGNSTGVWPGHWPPPNTPLCGFLANRCHSTNAWTLTAVAAGSVTALICLLSGAFLYRYIVQSRIVHSSWWLLDPSWYCSRSARLKLLQSHINYRWEARYFQSI